METADLVERIRQGRYVVIFAPRQTGKTTFFRWAIDVLAIEFGDYFPIQLDFQTFRNVSVDVFYEGLRLRFQREVEWVYQQRQTPLDKEFQSFLRNFPLKDHISFQLYLQEFASYLGTARVIIIIDEFDGIPPSALSDFLYTLREIYLSRKPHRCPYSVGIVGVRSITQLNYDRSVSPFNIQDEFALPNFTLEQVQELLGQYTEETGQPFAPEAIANLHQQTAGQPFLVNRMAQILTDEMDIPHTETIALHHFQKAHQQILEEQNVNISHLIANVRSNPRFKTLLMQVAAYEESIPFNLEDDAISELATYGVLRRGANGMCEVANPIYQYRIVRALQPLFNGLEREYHPEDTAAGFLDYLKPDGTLHMRGLLDNFRDFIRRTGYRILEVPETPQEFVGQYLLFAYLDQFVRQVQGFMYLEVPTGRGRMDLILLHEGRKYNVETKIWEGERLYQRGKQQLVSYVQTEGAREGYYVVFDHRNHPQARTEAEVINGVQLVCYTIPVVQQRPSGK